MAPGNIFTSVLSVLIHKGIKNSNTTLVSATNQIADSPPQALMSQLERLPISWQTPPGPTAHCPWHPNMADTPFVYILKVFEIMSNPLEFLNLFINTYGQLQLE